MKLVQSWNVNTRAKRSPRLVRGMTILLNEQWYVVDDCMTCLSSYQLHHDRVSMSLCHSGSVIVIVTDNNTVTLWQWQSEWQSVIVAVSPCHIVTVIVTDRVWVLQSFRQLYVQRDTWLRRLWLVSTQHSRWPMSAMHWRIIPRPVNVARRPWRLPASVTTIFSFQCCNTVYSTAIAFRK